MSDAANPAVAAADAAPDSDTQPPPPPWSLEGRLRSHLLLVLCALWLGGSALALLGLRHETAEVLDASLAETAQRLLVLPEAVLGNPDVGQLAAEIGEHEELVIYQIYDHHGRLRLRSHAAPDAPLDPNVGDGIREIGDWRVLTLTRDDDQRRAQVAELIAHRRHALWAGSSWLIGTLLAMLPIVALTLHLVLRRAFRSVERTRRTLEARPAHELGPLPEQDVPDELRPFLGTVNTLMQRLQHLVEAERAFAAHTAHELRTPLAAARAQAQRLVHETAEPKVVERAQALVRQLDRLTTLATRLLQLARIESGVALKREPVDLELLANIVADEFAEARHQGILQIRISENEPVVVQADLDALGIALRNLIDNALKHGRETRSDSDTPPLRVTIGIEPGQLSVTDNGPGVSPHLLPRLVQRFERGETPHDGSGLGLAMVATIARQSGAHLKMESPAEVGRGLRVTLHFSPA